MYKYIKKKNKITRALEKPINLSFCNKLNSRSTRPLLALEGIYLWIAFLIPLQRKALFLVEKYCALYFIKRQFPVDAFILCCFNVAILVDRKIEGREQKQCCDFTIPALNILSLYTRKKRKHSAWCQNWPPRLVDNIQIMAFLVFFRKYYEEIKRRTVVCSIRKITNSFYSDNLHVTSSSQLFFELQKHSFHTSKRWNIYTRSQK